MDELLEERVRVVLGELRASLGARRASVVPRGGPDPDLHGAGGLRTLPLGGGARLELEMGPMVRPDDEVDLALEHAVRALRAAARDTAAELPAVSVFAGPPPRPTRVADRVHAYLHALAALHHGQNALCVVHGEVVASASDPTPLELSRAELLVKRCQAAARAAGHGHGDLADDDAFVLTFWIGAALVLYFAEPYPLDFVRHRARAVARELSELLPELEPDPAAPAAALQPS
jgi:hypothetical protein